MKATKSDINKKGIIRIWIVWGAMFLSLFIYILVCNLIEPTWKPLVDRSFPVDTLRNVLYGISLIIFFLSSYIKKYIMKDASETQLRRFSEVASRTDMHPSLFKYQTAVIISLALSESIGIFGFIIFLLTKDMGTLYIFIVTSAIAMLYHIPKASEI